MRFYAAFVSAFICGVVIAASRVDAAELPEPLFTLEHEFVIPFATEAADGKKHSPAQTQLFVSADLGKTWNLYDTSVETEGSFVFRAPFDGEFWFVSRVADVRGRVTLEKNVEPEMRVVVGTCRTPQQIVAELPAAQSPDSVSTRMLNSRTFEIDYTDPQAPPPAGLTPVATKKCQVLLWWTGDGGQTWYPYGNDSDGHSPMRVSVDADGLYGLWLSIDNAAEAHDPTPRSGDAPQAWVAVDTTAPETHLTKAEVSTTEAGDELTIHWENTGEPLADDAIELAYASRPEGPWTSLDNVKGSGSSHTCHLAELRAAPTSGPTYFKLSAHDAAGNVCMSITSDPVLLPLAAKSEVSSPAAATAARGTRWYQVLR